MRRSRLRDEAGFTLIEVMAAALILVGGIFGLVASLDVFRAQASNDVAREAATHEAEQELEYLRSLGYRRLVLKTAPGAPDGPRDPRNGVSGTQYRPGPDTTYAPLVINAAAEGAIDQSRTWSAGRTSGTVYRFVTQEPAGTVGCGEICPRRASVGITYTTAGGVARSLVMSTLVVDSQAGTADETSTPPPPTPATCPCWSTLYLYDSLMENPERVPPSADHNVPRTTSFSGTGTVKRTEYPSLMGLDSPPNPFAGATTAPFAPPRYRYAAAEEATTGFGQTYPGGTLIKTSGSSCDGDGDPFKSARWTTRPVTQNTVLNGNFSAQIYTRLAGTLTGPGWLCFTFYDVQLSSTGKATWSKLNQQVTSYNQAVWPAGEPDQVSTDILRYRTTTPTFTLLPGHSLGFEISVKDAAAGAEAIFYDHPELASSVQVDSSPAFK